MTEARIAQLHACEARMEARVEQILERAQCRAALLSRAGCDLGRFRFETEPPAYTHTGFALRDPQGWHVYQMLNTHGGREGHLYRQPLIDFFRDDPHEYRCGVHAPSRPLQDRIAGVLRSSLAGCLYTRAYNRLAHPCSTRYQNSNQWVIEVIGAAQSGLRSRAAIQQHVADGGLKPSVLRTHGYLAQTVFAAFSRNTRFDDHPLRARLAGRIAFVTEASIRGYLQVSDRLVLDETVALHSDPSVAAVTEPAWAAHG